MRHEGAGREARAAGEGLALDALFEGTDVESVRGDMDKVHVRADGREGLVPAERLAFRIDIDLLHILHELHEMPRAGVQEIPAQHGRNPLYVNHFDTHSPESFLRSLQNLARMQPVRGYEQIRSFGKLRMTGRMNAQVIGKRHDAAPAIPAHHPAGPVGVVELHGEIDRWPIAVGHEGC